MTSERKKQGDEPKLSISSPQSAEEFESFHLHTREYNGGIPLSVHNPTSVEWGPKISCMDTAVREMNDNNFPGFWHTGNQFIQANSASMPGHNPNIGELAVSNFFMTGTAQPNHPGVADVDFLGLGCGISEETDSKWDIRSPDSKPITGRALLPLFKTSPDQIIARGSLNYVANMANESPSFPIFPVSHRRSTKEAPYQAPSLGRNASGQLPNPLPMQNVESSFNSMLNMARLSHQEHSMNRDNGVTNAGWFRPTRIPLSSSMVEFAQLASNQPQNPPITAVRNFSPGPVMVPPFTGVAGSMAGHNQSGPVTVPSCGGAPRSMLSHGQPGPVVVPFPWDFSSMPWHGQSGQPFPANATSAVEASQGIPFPKNTRVQQASKGTSNLKQIYGFLDQAQASVAVNPLKSTHAHAHTSDQAFQLVNVPQSSTSHSRPSLKRSASKLLPIGPAAQRRKTRSTIPSSPSMPILPPIAPHVPPSSVNSLKPRVSRLLQSQALLQSMLTTQSSNYIKWQEDDKIRPNGYECPICKRDLSYKPEGPLYEPDKLQPTSVLPCGHYFHDSCLLRVTPADQAANPPCIPCSMDR